MPKGSNSYGNRTIIVPSILKNKSYQGRVVVNGVSSNRNYSTGSATTLEVNVTKKLESLFVRSSQFISEPVDRDLYKLLCNVDLLSLAYDKLRSKPGQMTPGVSPETLDGMSKEVLKEISDRLRDESFQFHPGRRILIPKASGGTRPLTIAPPRDKLVQEAMRMILEAVFEPTFSDSSHGFRPGRGCHTALKAVRQNFQPSIWIIEGDISKCFDSIDHSKLMKIIEDKILDRKFTKLIWKSLKAGYFEFTIYHNNIIGTPQGSIISPILANIFMSQLDKKVEQLKKDFDIGNKSKLSTVASNYHNRIAYAKKRGRMDLVLSLAKEARRYPSADFNDPNFKKLSYVRYADDWMIGIKGTYEETIQILNLVRSHLNDMGLTLSEKKTKITNLNTSRALFLGTYINRATEYSFSRPSHSQYLKRNSKKLRLEAPIEHILNKLKDADFWRNGKPSPKLVWLPLEHRQIIHLYNAVFRGYLNYYSFTHNYPRIVSRLGLILRQSCAKLLATKFSLGTMAKTFDKFGRSLSVTHINDSNKKKVHSFLNPSYKITLKFLINSSPIIKALYGSVSLSTLDDLVCSICKSDYRVEMHHVRFMKDLNPKLGDIDKLMIRANRKQIPLCRECHMDYHHRNKSKNPTNK